MDETEGGAEASKPGCAGCGAGIPCAGRIWLECPVSKLKMPSAIECACVQEGGRTGAGAERGGVRGGQGGRGEQTHLFDHALRRRECLRIRRSFAFSTRTRIHILQAHVDVKHARRGR